MPDVRTSALSTQSLDRESFSRRNRTEFGAIFRIAIVKLAMDHVLEMAN